MYAKAPESEKETQRRRHEKSRDGCRGGDHPSIRLHGFSGKGRRRDQPYFRGWISHGVLAPSKQGLALDEVLLGGREAQQQLAGLAFDLSQLGELLVELHHRGGERRVTRARSLALGIRDGPT